MQTTWGAVIGEVVLTTEVFQDSQENPQDNSQLVRGWEGIAAGQPVKHEEVSRGPLYWIVNSCSLAEEVGVSRGVTDHNQASLCQPLFRLFLVVNLS